MRKLATGIVSLVVLAGCAVNYQPLPDGYNGPTAMVIDTMDQTSSTRVLFYELIAIDGRRVLSSSVSTASASAGQGFMMSTRSQSRLVPAGDVSLSIRGKTHVAAPILALGGRMFNVEGEVQVELEPDKGYYVRGFLGGDYEAVWIEDYEGNIVSPKIEQGQPPSD